MAHIPRHLIRWLFISCAVIIGNADDIDFLASIKPFDRPLSELTKSYIGTSLQEKELNFPPLAKALTACQHHQKEIKTKIDNLAGADSIGVCDKLRYLTDVKHLTESVRNHGTEVVLTKSDETSFSQLFMDYIEPRKPVILKSHTPLWTDEEIASLNNCASDSTFFRGVSLDTCDQDVLSAAKVPMIAANDYLVRLTPCALKGEPSFASCGQSPFMVTPSVIKLSQSGSETSLGEACPMSMSSVFEVLSGSVEVLLYDPTAEAEADGRPMLSPKVGGTPDTLHILTYSDEPFRLLKTINVIDGGLLFVPHGMLVAMRGEATLVKHCFTDAASLHTVRQKASIQAHVDKTTSLLASALSSLHLDTTMARQPVAMPYQDFMKWPRVEEGEGKDGKVKRAKRKSQSDWQAETKWKWRIVALTMPKLEPPIIKSIGRQNATIGWLSGFQVAEGDATDFGYNLTWHFGHETAEAGGISVKHADLLKEGRAKFAFDNYNAFDLTHTIPDGSLLPSTEYSFRVGVYYGQARSPPSGSSSSFTTPSMQGPSRMNTAPKLATSTSAEVNPIGALSTGVTLLAYPPLDDGGSKVVAYIIQAKHVQPHMSGDWEVLGSFQPVMSDGMLVFNIGHLIPHTSYQFRIAAYNEMGMGEFGSPSESIYTGAEKSHDNHVHGHGAKVFTPHHIAEQVDQTEGSGNSASNKLKAHLTALLDPHVFQVHGPVVTLEDTKSLLHYKRKSDFQGEEAGHETSHQMEVWSGHWSPKHFKVSAEMIVTDPPLAERKLDNARAVRGRIALVERGVVPLVEKVLNVQAAGGIGVIIDAGDCTAFDQFCSPGAEKKNGDGFGMLDKAAPWERIRIPVVMLLRDDVDILLGLFE